MAAQQKVWSQDDLRRLMTQGKNHGLDGDFRELNFVTRDKSPDYYTTIFKQKGGVMEPYKKDSYGSPQNPINGNGKLKGLFFSAKVDWRNGGLPFPDSAFGEWRLQLPVNLLLTLKKHLYFADLYCMSSSSSKEHNVTLVLCEPDSEGDQFCRNALPQLDICANAYLKIVPENPKEGTPQKVWVTGNSYVEIFYAGDLNISNYEEYMKQVKKYGKRASKPSKNPSCEKCNLQPLLPQNQ